MQYNNPTAAKGLVDSSGFKLYYTRQLRPNDMGVLTLGSYDINVPGGGFLLDGSLNGFSYHLPPA